MTPHAVLEVNPAVSIPVEEKDQRMEAVHALAMSRWRVAGVLTVLMLIVYFSFILGIAFDKAMMGSLLVPGLSVGIVLGVLVIFSAFALTAAYAYWANTQYDPALEALVGKEKRK